MRADGDLPDRRLSDPPLDPEGRAGLNHARRDFLNGDLPVPV